MKKCSEIREHLLDTVYSLRAQRQIRAFLSDKIILYQNLRFAERRRNEASHSISDFLKWYHDDSNESVIKAVPVEKSIFAKVEIGDWVKVHDLDNPRNEIVEGTGVVDDEIVYLLSDGTWVKEYAVTAYEAQGLERQYYIDRLNKLKNE